MYEMGIHIEDMMFDFIDDSIYFLWWRTYPFQWY